MVKNLTQNIGNMIIQLILGQINQQTNKTKTNKNLQNKPKTSRENDNTRKIPALHLANFIIQPVIMPMNASNYQKSQLYLDNKQRKQTTNKTDK